MAYREHLLLKGSLKGHSGWVTQLTTNPNYPDILLSASRDKSLILWKITGEDGDFGYPDRAMRGHEHFVSDVCISSDGQYALSSSWDHDLRLWDLQDGRTTKRFKGHTKDALSVAISSDNRQILSSSRDRTIRLWNTLAEEKYTFHDDNHNDWVSCVRYSPSTQAPVMVSCGWDKTVKVWNMSNCRIKTNHYGHTGYLNCVTVSPDGSLCASGGKDGLSMLWDLNDDKHLHTLVAGEEITALCFSPNRYWLCAAAGPYIKIWDLENKQIVDEKKIDAIPEQGKSKKAGKSPICLSLTWSRDGNHLYAGYTDNLIRVFKVTDV